MLLIRSVLAGQRDWTDSSGLRLALDGEQAPYAVQIQLQEGGGFVQSPLITLDQSGWNEVYVPFHRFDNILATTEFDWSLVTAERLVLRFQGADFDPHTAYIGAWERSLRSSPQLPQPNTATTRAISVALGGGVTAELVVGRDDNLLYGLGGIHERGTLLRTQGLAHLIHPVVYDRDGGEHEVFQFDGISRHANVTTVRATSPDSDMSLRWEFSPAQRTIDKKQFHGLRYHYEVTSDNVTVDKVEERTTWELGGNTVGNTAVLRSSSYATETSGAVEDAFDTRPYSGAMPPRFAYIGAFEYHAGPLGELLITYDRADLVSGWFAKRAGQDVFEYADTYHLRQATQATTPQKLVLHARQPIEPGIDLINAHTAAHDAVHRGFRAMYGIQEPQIAPSVTVHGGEQHLDDYAANGWLTKGSDLGFKIVHLGQLWNSDAENGGPSAANGVTVWTFDVAEPLGGNPALRRLTASVQEQGIAIDIWAPAAHMSKNAPVVKQHPQWHAKGPYGAGNSTYWSLATIDMNDLDARAHLLAGLTERRTLDGLGGVWLDTLHPHGFSQYDHANSVVSPHVDNMIAHLLELQKAGLTVYTERRGPFGVPSSGYNTGRLDFYQGKEYRAYETSMNFSVPTEAIDFYRFAANKALPFNVWDERLTFWQELQVDVDLQNRIRQTNNDYNTVARYMDKRRLLADDHGVEWASGTGAGKVLVLFAYDPFDYPLPDGAVVTDVTTAEGVSAEQHILNTQSRHTYLITRV